MPIRLTKAVKTLIAICFITFLIQQTGDQFLGTHLMGWLALTPSIVSSYRVWQVVTYSFVHRDVLQLIFNLMMLAFIGGELEALWGTLRFVKYYFFCTVSAALLYIVLQVFLSQRVGYLPPMMGASAAVYGLLVAYGILFGERVLLFMMLFPMKAKHFVWVLALIEVLTTLYSSGGTWAGVAQLGSMAAGFVYLWSSARWKIYQRDQSVKHPQKRQKKKRSPHLKLIVNNDQDLEIPEDDSPDNPRTWH